MTGRKTGVSEREQRGSVQTSGKKVGGRKVYQKRGQGGREAYQQGEKAELVGVERPPVGGGGDHPPPGQQAPVGRVHRLWWGVM